MKEEVGSAGGFRAFNEELTFLSPLENTSLSQLSARLSPTRAHNFLIH